MNDIKLNTFSCVFMKNNSLKLRVAIAYFILLFYIICNTLYYKIKYQKKKESRQPDISFRGKCEFIKTNQLYEITNNKIMFVKILIKYL